jgi:hypothetical protein
MRTGFIVAPIIAMALTGCGVQSAVIRSQALSYDDIIEDTTDKLLLLNILRAKDKAPLHFDEIPSIHESIQATASVQATWPFGATDTGNKPTTRNSVTPGLMVQATPTFEVDHLDTKDFVTGIASPIDPKFVKYWLDRGLDQRLVLLLFFSAATITETKTVGENKTVTTIRVTNSPREAIDALHKQEQLLNDGPLPQGELRCDALSDFQHYLKFIDSLKPLSAQYFKKPRPLAENIRGDQSTGKALDNSPESSNKASDKASDKATDKGSDKGNAPNWQAIASLDPEKFQWIRNKDGTFNVYALPAEANTTLCPISADTDSQGPEAACIELGVEKNPDELSAPRQYPRAAPPIERRSHHPSGYCAVFNDLLPGEATQHVARRNVTIEIRFEIRSVGEMIQFLGDLLEYQEELALMLKASPAGGLELNDPLTFGYCGGAPRDYAAGCNDVFFNLPSDTCNSRFAVSYRGKTYAVPNYNPPDGNSCPTDRLSTRSTLPKDHTLEVLSVVHQMVDLQKSSQDIRETPYVQVLP